MAKGLKRKSDVLCTSENRESSNVKSTGKQIKRLKIDSTTTTKPKQNVQRKSRLTGDLKLCNDLIKELLSRKHWKYAWPFHKPVNVKELGLHDYHDIIQHPMDLGTIQKKMNDRQYTNISDFAEDVRLVVSNCLVYNPPDHDIIQMARQLSIAFETKFEKIAHDSKVNVPKARVHKQNPTLLSKQKNSDPGKRTLLPQGMTSLDCIDEPEVEDVAECNPSVSPKAEPLTSLDSCRSTDVSPTKDSTLNRSISPKAVLVDSGLSSEESEKSQDDLLIAEIQEQMKQLQEKVDFLLKRRNDRTLNTESCKRRKISNNEHVVTATTKSSRNNDSGEVVIKSPVAARHQRPKTKRKLTTPIRKSNDNQSSTTPSATINATKLVERLNSLTADDIVEVFNIIKSREPAYKQYGEGDEIEIDFESLQQSTVQEVEKFLIARSTNDAKLDFVPSEPKNDGKVTEKTVEVCKDKTEKSDQSVSEKKIVKGQLNDSLSWAGNISSSDSSDSE